MAVANLNKTENKSAKKIEQTLQEIYKDKITTTVALQPQPFVDKTDLLLNQMNFIAAYNKQLLHTSFNSIYICIFFIIYYNRNCNKKDEIIDERVWYRNNSFK